jgi:hypothetical protein
MSDPIPSINEIITSLDKYERRVLRFLGKEHISNNKNVRLETIKKNLPNRYGKNVDNALKSLKSKVYVYNYRHKNYGLSPLGKKVAEKIYDDFMKDRHADLNRILMVQIYGIRPRS